jgi:tetratricopeptide (TPR) repeat protein
MLARCLKDGRRYDEALIEYDRAASYVVPDAVHDDLVVDIAIGRANVAYWRGDMAGAVSVLEGSRSVVERRASPQRRAQYDESLLTARLGLQRFRADPALLTLAAKVNAAKLQHGGHRDQAWGLFTYGCCLLCGDRLDDAEKCLLQALEDARTTEDAQLEARALTYYSVVARLRRDEKAVRELDQRVAEAAHVAGLDQYEAVAVGNRAWLSLLAGDVARARAEAEAALTAWASSPTYFPFQWIALLPLIAALVAQGNAADAVGAVHALLDERMQALPEVVQAAAESVLHLSDADNATLTAGLSRLLIAAQSAGMA